MATKWINAAALRPALLGALVIGICAFATGARAEFSVCNKTSYVIRTAVAFKGAQDWVSAGWFTVYPGFCRAIIDKPLANSTYFLHGRSIEGHNGPMRHWAGDDRFCVSQGDFDITGAGDCDKRGFDSAYFSPVDVGAAEKWTTSFTEPAAYDLQKAQIFGTQRLLADLGYIPEGNIDGYLGHSTVRAIGQFARSRGLSVPEQPSMDLLKALAQAAEERTRAVGLEVCNRTSYGVWASIGIPRGQNVNTKGWYELKPGQCIRPIAEKLATSLVYLYAETVDSAAKKLFWHGSDKLCANDVMFSLVGPPGSCEDKTLVPVSYLRVNTQGRDRWTYELKEEDARLDPGA